MAKFNQFTIDDAFEESEEDKIRLYNSESTELQLVLHEEEEEEHKLREPSTPDDVFLSPKKSIIKKPILVNPTLRGLKARDDNTSQDSNSLIQGQGAGYYGGPYQEKFWWKHPKIKQNLKMVIAATVLVVLGACLILTGIVIYCFPSLKELQGFIFLIAGIICFLPGGYHLIYIYLAVKGKRGFDFHHLPLFT